MTRRDLLLLPFGAPLFSSSGEFWNEKKPSDWTDDEIQEMLTRSPWAKEGSVSVFGGAGGNLLNRNGAMNRSGNMSSSSGRQRVSTTQTQSADAPDLRYKAIVRWQSALPIQEALKTKVAAAADYYILAVVGDLAMADPDADEAQRESRLDMMKQYTKLDRHGGSIPLANV
jgi:hypothetical protein